MSHREFTRPVPSPGRETRKKEWSQNGSRGSHPLVIVFSSLVVATSEGMRWLVNDSAYYPRGVWERVPDPFDLPWPEVVFLLEKAKALAPRLNPVVLDRLISSIKSKDSKDFPCDLQAVA